MKCPFGNAITSERDANSDCSGHTEVSAILLRKGVSCEAWVPMSKLTGDRNLTAPYVVFNLLRTIFKKNLIAKNLGLW